MALLYALKRIPLQFRVEGIVADMEFKLPVSAAEGLAASVAALALATRPARSERVPVEERALARTEEYAARLLHHVSSLADVRRRDRGDDVVSVRDVVEAMRATGGGALLRKVPPPVLPVGGGATAPQPDLQAVVQPEQSEPAVTANWTETAHDLPEGVDPHDGVHLGVKGMPGDGSHGLHDALPGDEDAAGAGGGEDSSGVQGAAPTGHNASGEPGAASSPTPLASNLHNAGGLKTKPDPVEAPTRPLTVQPDWHAQFEEVTGVPVTEITPALFAAYKIKVLALLTEFETV